MSELYSHLYEELEMRLAKAERVECGFNLPKATLGDCENKELAAVIDPSAPKKSGAKSGDEVAA